MTRMDQMKGRQRGAVLIVAALASLLVLFGVMGVALNLSHAYDLKSELQNVADAAALSGAKSLDGTTAGIVAARDKAIATAQANKFNFSSPLVLTDANIGFSASPDASTWLSVSQAEAAPAGLLFIKVSTGSRTSVVGTVANFMAVAGVATPLATSASAVAGRFSLAVAPLAVCAIETTKYGQIAHTGLPSELKEFGYRRGVSYNVLAINPLGSSAQKFLLNPIDVPPAPNDPSGCTSSNSSAATVGPYLCTGNASIITTLPGYVYVNTGMSSTLSKDLNSRFNTYGSSDCSPATAPPDANVQPYTTPGSVNWMNPTPSASQQTMALGSSPAIPLSPVPNAGSYGVLWSYNAAVQYAATPPAGGYTPYTTANWPKLYPTTTAPTPAAKANYPTGGPYSQTSGAGFFLAPTPNGPGTRDRRVLNLAIVDCSTLSASGGNSCKTIRVLGLGRFFMTVPANLPSDLDLEFAGLIPDASLTAEIRLYH